MAQIGLLGDIVFEVSDETILTIENMSWSGSARYAAHERHLYDVKTEYLGVDADQIQLDITLSAYLGVNPQQLLTKLWKYERSGQTLPLVIGRKGYGKYRWTITKHSTTMTSYDNDGDLTQCTVTINLQEYVWW